MFWLILSTHVLGATVWTGGHLVLATTVLPRALAAHDPGILLRFEQGFERIGIPALVIQVLTGLWLAMGAADPLHWLTFEDPVTAAVGVKLCLLAVTAGFALNARFRVIPTLSADTLTLMAWHIRAVTLLSVAFVLAGVFIRTGGW